MSQARGDRQKGIFLRYARHLAMGVVSPADCTSVGAADAAGVSFAHRDREEGALGCLGRYADPIGAPAQDFLIAAPNCAGAAFAARGDGLEGCARGRIGVDQPPAHYLLVTAANSAGLQMTGGDGREGFIGRSAGDLTADVEPPTDHLTIAAADPAGVVRAGRDGLEGFFLRDLRDGGAGVGPPADNVLVAAADCAGVALSSGDRVEGLARRRS